MGGGQPKWLSNSIAKLAIYDAWLSDGYITVDISAGKQAKAVSGSVDSDLRKYSPQKTFMVECSSGMKMNQVEEKRLVSETSLTPHLSAGVCSNFIQWAPDESVASFIASDDSVYTWISDGTAPRKVVDHALTVSDWSPDSQKLAIKTSEAATQLGIVNIINRDGKLLNEFQIQSKGEEGLGWLTNDVLMVRYSRYTNWYYAIRTGQFLFSWTSMPTAGLFYQDPQVSPDNRWVFIDQGNEERASTLNPNHYIVRKEYSLFDIQTGKRYVLTDNWSTYLGYAGWNADSTTLYTVSPPVEAGSTAVSNVPYGLLGYDIQTHEYHLLVKDAVQVAWNNDKSRAFVVFATKGKEGQLGLDGGLWKVGTTTLISQWHISDQVVYQDPARDSFFVAFPGLVSIAWSHNNKYVAVSDELGQIKILRNEN